MLYRRKPDNVSTPLLPILRRSVHAERSGHRHKPGKGMRRTNRDQGHVRKGKTTTVPLPSYNLQSLLLRLLTWWIARQKMHFNNWIVAAEIDQPPRICVASHCHGTSSSYHSVHSKFRSLAILACRLARHLLERRVGQSYEIIFPIVCTRNV